jgi:hypothetical protein
LLGGIDLVRLEVSGQIYFFIFADPYILVVELDTEFSVKCGGTRRIAGDYSVEPRF